MREPNVWRVIFAVLVLSGLAARAAEPADRIHGTVVDTTGAAIGKADVRLFTNVDNTKSPAYQTTSSDDGSFKFTAVAADTFTLKIKAPGFQETTLPIDARHPTNLGKLTLQVLGCDDPSVICCLQITSSAKR